MKGLGYGGKTEDVCGVGAHQQLVCKHARRQRVHYLGGWGANRWVRVSRSLRVG